MKRWIFLICAVFLMMPTYAGAQDDLTTSCSTQYYCTCVTDTQSSPISASNNSLDDVEAARACEKGCFDLNFEGYWELKCSASLVDQGPIPVPSVPVAEPKKEYRKPNLSVPLPGFAGFSDPYEEGNKVHVPYLAEYIYAIYSLVIVIATIAVVLAIMIAGLKWMMARGDAGAVSGAKEMIGKSLTSLLILIGIVSLVSLVDPELTKLGNIAVRIVQPQELVLNSMIRERLAGCPDVKGTVTQCSVSTFKNPGDWDVKLVNAINNSARKHGVDAIQLAAHIEIETRHNINWGDQIGPCGEIGPSQFMPTTYETTTGDSTCCTAVSRKGGKNNDSTAACDGNYVEWPPDPAQIPNCRTDICGSCQVPATSCIEKFRSPENIQFVTDTTAQYIKTLRNKTNDIALSMCAYNGSGERAANYTRTAAGYYQQFCNSSQ